MSVISDQEAVAFYKRQLADLNAAGSLFNTSTDFSLATTADRKAGVVTSTAEIALAFSIMTDSPDYTVEVYEDLASTGGTTPTLVCLNRVEKNTALTIFKENVTATTVTPLFSRRIVGSVGRGNQADAAQDFSSDVFLILPVSAEYVLRVVNNDTSTHVFSASATVAERS